MWMALGHWASCCFQGKINKNDRKYLIDFIHILKLFPKIFFKDKEKVFKHLKGIAFLGFFKKDILVSFQHFLEIEQHVLDTNSGKQLS